MLRNPASIMSEYPSRGVIDVWGINPRPTLPRLRKSRSAKFDAGCIAGEFWNTSRICPPANDFELVCHTSTTPGPSLFLFLSTPHFNAASCDTLRGGRLGFALTLVCHRWL